MYYKVKAGTVCSLRRTSHSCLVGSFGMNAKELMYSRSRVKGAPCEANIYVKRKVLGQMLEFQGSFVCLKEYLSHPNEMPWPADPSLYTIGVFRELFCSR